MDPLLRACCVPLLAISFGCSAAPDPAIHARQILVRIESRSAPLNLSIERFGAIFWSLPADQAVVGDVRVVVDGPLSGSSPCSTTYGFEEPAMGKRRSLPIAPGTGVAICFHESGRFGYRVEGLAEPLEGVVEVEEPR